MAVSLKFNMLSTFLLLYMAFCVEFASAWTLRLPGRTTHKLHRNRHSTALFFQSPLRTDVAGVKLFARYPDEPPPSSESIFYDDFGNQDELQWPNQESSMPSSSSQLLQDRLASLQQSEQEESRRIERNWKLGNWNVRGFSLDPWRSEAAAGEDSPKDLEEERDRPIHITLVVGDDYDSSEARVWVGRTDGSLLLVRLGTEHWTSFKSKLTVTSDEVSNDDDSVTQNEKGTIFRVSNHLEQHPSNQRAETDAESDHSEQPWADPFEILWQFAPSLSWISQAAPISHILPIGRSRLFTVSSTSKGSIQMWKVRDHGVSSDDESHDIQVSPQKMLQGVHSSDLTLLARASSGRMLLSIAEDGSLALWNTKTGALIFTVNNILIADVDADEHSELEGSSVTSAATDGTYIFVGTSSGIILAYKILNMLNEVPEESSGRVIQCGRWFDNKDGIPITAIACAGAGSSIGGTGIQAPSLLTGSKDGTIKQWELLPRTLENGNVHLEQWPKLSTQRLRSKAHIFKGHEGSVSALRSVDGAKILSAASDGTVRAWNPTSGKELFCMSGFTEKVTNLCLLGDMLITNGMKQFVAVHDFTDDHQDKDYDLEMPEYEQ